MGNSKRANPESPIRTRDSLHRGPARPPKFSRVRTRTPFTRILNTQNILPDHLSRSTDSRMSRWNRRLMTCSRSGLFWDPAQGCWLGELTRPVVTVRSRSISELVEEFVAFNLLTYHLDVDFRTASDVAFQKSTSKWFASVNTFPILSSWRKWTAGGCG